MLVKLGDIWIDPQQVSALGPNENGAKVSVVVAGIIHYPKNILVDDCANIINNTYQSFGGEDEAPKEN